MRKHMTQGEILRIERLLARGVIDLAEIQSHVLIHVDCIKQVVAKHEAAKPKPKLKAVSKKESAADRAKAKAAAVDPLT